ncbi:type III-B CRISPR-associated protein Cas10/Cmr2 [Sulfurihydrogenibium sp.]|jgi:CRISPR-associated protein Cmr2|uniref:type III-B CRISPR-associated protein Cas10/Cmr2 n=1 Tax=Sulfurihydrogenibium sp. TaxID=2053621 RepID=UPI002626206B|nr:type III-B CRISPR-associated protein Cas10/Cmr2 [Sulfurihydrogenibium sp.]
MAKYLVKITIPSIQDTIVRSRKLKDLTGGSELIPRIMQSGLKSLANDGKVEFIIPTADVVKEDSLNITNVAYLAIEGEKEQVTEKVKRMKEEMLKKLNTLVDTVKHRIPDKEFSIYENLIRYQIKNAINIVWAISEIKDNNIVKAKNDVDIAVANAKASIEPDDKFIEGFNLIQKQKNQYSAFENYQDFMEKAYQINPELIRGAYLCEVCGKRVILGATKNNFKSSITEKDEEDRLCAFCYAKRYYHGKHKKSVVDVALKKYLAEHGNRIQEIFKKHGKIDLLEEDKQNIYIEVLENNGENPDLIKSLNELYREIGKPPVYYAIVVMDGDSMGEKISKAFEENKIKIITKKLSEFSKEVKGIVEKYSGMSVYSGGDDLLALFPLKTVLEGYKEIVEKFKEYMKDTGYNFTASAGLVISHYKIPLNYVLQEARSAESKAKKVDGKDAVYIKYIKHSFSSAEAPIKNDHLQLFEELISFLSDEDFPFGFIYQLQELLLPYLPKTENEEPVKKLTKYLIEKKPYKRKDEFAKFMLDTKELFDFKEPEKIINTLKVAKFIASGV